MADIAKATPRPWETEVEHDGVTSTFPPVIYAHDENDHYVLVCVFSDGGVMRLDEDVARANANLIVTAVNEYDRLRERVAALEALLAKAPNITKFETAVGFRRAAFEFVREALVALEATDE